MSATEIQAALRHEGWGTAPRTRIPSTRKIELVKKDYREAKEREAADWSFAAAAADDPEGAGLTVEVLSIVIQDAALFARLPAKDQANLRDQLDLGPARPLVPVEAARRAVRIPMKVGLWVARLRRAVPALPPHVALRLAYLYSTAEWLGEDAPQLDAYLALGLWRGDEVLDDAIARGLLPSEWGDLFRSASKERNDG